MPANLTPEYKEAEQAYREARSTEEKLQALERMLQVIPKHKGTEHLQADIKRRIAKLKSEGKKGGTASRRSSMFNIPREGAAQVVLVGPPNAGKSAILNSVTNANAEEAPYPYSTFKPLPGMMHYENIQIQLVDLPPIGKEKCERWVFGIVRNADLALLVINLADPELLDNLEFVLAKLEEGKVLLVREVTERFMPDGRAQVKAVMIGTHLDHPEARDNLEVLQDLYGALFPVEALAVKSKEDVERFRHLVYHRLGIIRVYTKAPGKKPDLDDPVILPQGATVQDFARNIHKDFARDLKFARIWGKEKFDGQKVQRDYVLEDQDVVELHM